MGANNLEGMFEDDRGSLVSITDSISSYRSFEDPAVFATHKPAEPPLPVDSILPTMKRIPMLLAAALGLIFYFVPLFDNEFANRCFSMLVIVSTLWALEGVPLFITSLMIPVIVVWFKILPDTDGVTPLPASTAANVISEQFWSPTIFLFLGGFSIAAGLEKYGLNRALATFIISRVPAKPWLILFVVMALCTFLSAWISNPAAAVLCVSVVLPILKDLPEDSKYPRAMLLGIAFAGNVGGMTTPISSPQNAIALSTLADLSPPESISFIDWMIVSVPFCTISLIGCFLLVWFIIRPTEKEIPTVAAVPIKLGFAHYFILGIAVLTVILWFFEGQIEDFTGNIGITALIPVICYFGSGYLTVKDFDSLAWNILMLMGGGLSLGYAIQASSLLDIISNQLAELVDGLSVWVVMLAFSLLVIAIGTFISSTVAAIVVLPIVANVGQQIGHARLLVYVCVIMCSGAMALPVSSFPNANSFAVKDDKSGRSVLYVTDYLKVGLPVAVFLIINSQTVLFGLATLLNF